MNDPEYLAICRSNPSQGLSLIMDAYINLVYSIIKGKISLYGCEEDIKECVSDVFLEFYQQLDQIDLSKGSIKAYLAKIATHKGIDCYRKLMRIHGKTTFLESFEETNQDIIQLKGSPDHLILQKEERNIISDAIKSLGEPDSEIFIRRYYLGQSTKEIAGTMHIKPNTIDKKISRGLKKLRFMLGGMLNEQESKSNA